MRNFQIFVNLKFAKRRQIYQKAVGKGDPKRNSSSLNAHQLLPEEKNIEQQKR